MLILAFNALMRGECGAMINTASVAAQDEQRGQAPCGASTARIAGMTLLILGEPIGEGIRVNTMLAGIFNTPL